MALTVGLERRVGAPGPLSTYMSKTCLFLNPIRDPRGSSRPVFYSLSLRTKIDTSKRDDKSKPVPQLSFLNMIIGYPDSYLPARFLLSKIIQQTFCIFNCCE